MNNSVKKSELYRFIVVGSCAVLTDFSVYKLLITLAGVAHGPAKATSFITGSLLAYLLNKHWTFKKKGYSKKEILQFAFLYASTLIANVFVNQAMLFLFPAQILIAFLFATGTSTILNFIGQKWWVFRP